MHCLVDLVLRQIGGCSDGDLLLLAGAEVLSGYVYDAVCVDIEGNLDLRNAARCRSNAVEGEAAEGLVACSHLALALQNVNLNGRLVISCGGEDLALLGRDGGVAVDQLGAYAAEGLNTEGQRSYVEQQHVLDLAAENAALDGCADCYALVRVDALEAFLAGDALNSLLYSRNTGGTANQQDLGQIGSGQTSVAHSLANRAHGALYEVCGQLVELCTGQGQLEVLRAGSVSGDIRLVDGGLAHAGQLDLRLLSSFLQALHSHTVVRQVNAVGLLELVNHPVDDALVEVIAAEVGITCGGQNLQNALADIQDGYIERTAAEVVNHDLLLRFLIYAVSQRSSGRLVDDTQNFQTCDLAGILGSLTLRVREVSRNGDDRLIYRLAEVCFCVSLQLLQDHSGNLLRGVRLAVDVYAVVGAHVTLDRNNGTVSVGYSLALSDLTDHTLAVLGKCNNRRSGARTLSVRDDYGFAALHNRYTRVRRTKVNTNDLTHNKYTP